MINTSNPLIRFFLFFLFVSSQFGHLYSLSPEEGPRPQSFCVPQTFRAIPIANTNLDGAIIRNLTSFSETDGSILSVGLTDGNSEYLSSQLWLQNKIDYQNGFETEFQMDISAIGCRKSTCTSSAFYICTYETKRSCGGDGFAFVMQSSDSKFKGLSGSGLGYADVMNSIAVEFDAVYNPAKNDPNTDIERHISLIAVRGQNTADENNALARNEEPANFKNAESSNFISQPIIKIQYLNKNWRVFMNGVQQLAYYSPFPLSNIFPNVPQTWVGITASTSEVKTQYKVLSWSMKIVTHSVLNSKVVLTNPSSSVRSKDDFTVDILLRDECDNVYNPIEDFDSISQLTYDKASVLDCDLRERVQGTDQTFAYRFKFNCANIGLHTFSFSYQDKKLNTVEVNVIPGVFYRAELSFPWGTQGSIDNGLKFNFVAYDFSKNIVDVASDVVLSKLNIVFPNSANSIKNFAITKQADKTFLVEFTSDIIGNYYIQDSIFRLEVDSGRYDFYFIEGAFYANNSYATLYEGNVNIEITKANELTRTEIPAGTPLTLKIVYKDRVGNEISSSRMDLSKMRNLIFVNGKSGLLSDLRPGARLYYSFIKTEKAGQYSLKINYNSQGIVCTNCIFTVQPLAADFGHSSLFQYDFKEMRYNTLVTNDFVVNKGEDFNYQLLLRDIYDNMVQVSNVNAFTATLSGNRMAELSLNLSSLQSGIRLEISNDVLEYYRNLVGKTNYTIKVIQVSSQSNKTWNLEIKSDGTDSDSGNSELEPLRTAFVWADPISVSKGAVAGTSYRAILTLKNKEGSRYNGWLAETEIPTTLAFLDGTESLSVLKRGSLKGIYYIDVVTKIVLGKFNTLSAKVKTTLKRLLFKTIANDGFQGIIDRSALIDQSNLLEGTVNKEYNFTFLTYDTFMNPQDVEATNLILQSLDDTTKTFAIASTRLTIGVYYCLVTPTFPGKYSVKSNFISNAKVNDYNVNFRRGEPSASTSVATLVNNVSLGVEAGSTLTFKITARDESGLALSQAEVQEALGNFTASVKEPRLDTYTNIALVTVDSNGDIFATVVITRAGLNVFTVSFKNTNLQCLVCSVNLYAADVDLTKISIYVLSTSTSGQVESPLSSTTAFIIDNSKVDPIFLMRFSDKYGNKRNYSSELTFTGVITVPNGAQKTYSLESQGWSDAIKFSVSEAQFKYFKSELKNENCTGLFRATNTNTKAVGESNNKLFLTGGSTDDMYSNDDIDPIVSKIDPTILSVTAGNWADMNIELRTANGKLFNHPLTFGFYSDPSSAFQIKLDDGSTLDAGIKEGKLKGTYTIHFTSYKSYIDGINVTILYLDPNDNTNTSFIEIKTKVNIIVHPGTLDYLVLADESLIKDGVAGDTKSLPFSPYDKFKNLIPKISLTSMNFVISSSVNENIQTKIAQNTNGIVVLTYSAQKVSVITITALKFLNENGTIVPNYTYNIGPAAMNPSHSIASLDSDSLDAGEIISLKIYPRDQYDNYVPFSKEFASTLSASTQEPGSTSIIPIITEPLFNDDNDNSYYYWNFNLTKAGTHEFKAYLGDQIIASNNFRALVSPIEADFQQTTLGLYNALTSVYDLYDGSHFEQDVSALPDFKALFSDKYQNPVTLFPKNWDLSLYLTNEELGAKNGIIFCRQSDNATFRMCSDNNLQPSLIVPARRWADLVTPKNYTLILKNISDTQSNFTLELTGNTTDSDTSNLPIDVQNTVFSSESLHSEVNIPTSFQIFVMTTNPNLRRNEWFEKPNESIKLTFGSDNGNISYNIIYGEKKGIYKVTVLSTIAYPINANLITVSINNIAVNNKNVKLFVAAGAPNIIYPVDSKLVILNEIPSITVDTHFSQAFIAKDIYMNIIDLNSDTPGANSIIYGSSGDSIAHIKTFPINSDIVVLDFQPKVPGTYKVYFNEKSIYSFQVTQGSVNVGQSSATVSPSKQTAGGKVEITITPRDQFGNLLALTVKDISTYAYFIANPDDLNTYREGTNVGIVVNGSSIVFSEVVTIKGLYSFKTAISAVAITMTLSRVVVSPADISLKDSILQYYDTALMKYSNAAKDIPIKEDNLKTYPRYLLFLADQYGNIYDEFPSEIQSNFSVTLYGNNFKKTTPVLYDADQLQGNALYITVEDSDKQRYQNGIYETTPYNLSIILTTTKEEVLYPIILLGEGSDDNDADIEIPMDISKTFLSRQTLSFVAGSSDSFLIEVRTGLGTRKADIGTPTFNFIFTQSDQLTDGEFSASVIKGDLRGRFLVTVTGTKANKMVGTTTLNITINGLLVPKTVNNTVLPGDLHHADLIQYMGVITADNDYGFNVIPRDIYNNIPLIKAAELNLIITFPVGIIGTKVYSGESDLGNNTVKFTVKTRYSGIYTISSQYLNRSANFSVIPGIANAKFTLVTVSPSSLRAGESASVSITPYDSYNNRILPFSSRGQEVLQALEMSSALAGNISKYKLSLDNNNNVVLGSFIYTAVGLVTVVVNVNNLQVTCPSCSVAYRPAAINLQRTRFFTVSALGINSTLQVSLEAGRTNFNLLAQLYDRYDNSIQELTTDDNFSMVLSGNNMDSMDLSVQREENSTNSLDITVLEEKSNQFALLVPANNYNLKLTYSYLQKANQTADLLLRLTGEDNGGGNGPYILKNTAVNPLNLTLQAGEEGTVVIELRTSENKRFNGYFDINKLLPSETNNSFSNNDSLSTSIYFGEFSGRFKLSLKSFKAMPAKTMKLVQLSVDGQLLADIINVFITPSVPDISKTLITQQLPFTLYSNVESSASIKLFDAYNNAYVLPDWASKISGQVISGHANFGQTIFNSTTSEYIVKVTAVYPPRVVSVQLYYTQAVGREFPILQFPFISQILTQLDVNQTQLTGAQLSGIAIGKDFGFNVLLKDTSGYCYETTKTVQVVVSGPYKFADKTSNEAVAGAILVKLTPVVKTMQPLANDSSTNIQSNGYICNKYYSTLIYGNQLQVAGFYQIDIYLPELKTTPVSTTRDAYMSSGDLNQASTLISLQGVTLDTFDSYTVAVNTPFTIRAQLRDSFKNSIFSSSNVTFDFVLSDVSYKAGTDYKIVIISKDKGYIDFQLNIFKVGALPVGQLTINGQQVLWSALDKLNFPNRIQVISGPCSSATPSIDSETLVSKGASIGSRSSFLITCKDSFSNLVVTGGDIFTVQIIGNDIATAKSEAIPNNVVDKANGQYSVDFVPNWPGTYTVTIQLNGVNYAPSWTFTAIGSSCPASTPYICVNNNKCVASYRDCGFADLNCPTSDKSFLCNVGGVQTCVARQSECDCASDDLIKCSADKKCVSFLDVDFVCSTAGQNPGIITCPQNADVICEDGSCRATASECPSQPGCPPQYKLCVDQTCALKNETCQYQSNEECPFDRFYRCSDYHCVSEAYYCPTSITCPKAGQILCPNKKCADSELQCGSVPKCETGQFLCPDTSCASSFDACPLGIVCPIGQALCLDGSCKTSCTSESSRLLVRLLRSLNSNDTIGCPENRVTCPFGLECVDSLGQCPSSVTCAEGEVKCSAMVCAKSLNECPQVTCPLDQVLCWDNSCADDNTECPTKISCPEAYKKLCSDGNCVAENTTCPPTSRCPSSRPFKCGSGDCRKKISDCPTQKTCPPSHNYRCQDGSCVSNRESCLNNVEFSRCGADEINCGDNSCAESLDKCPTATSCMKGQLRCWDNQCVDTLEDCSAMEATDEVCPSTSNVQCPDGSCALTIKNCPTGVICPSNYPLKCEDGNCRSSLEDCLPYTYCSDGKLKSDGTCADKSGTTVTCSTKQPYKCFDGTCRDHPFNCPDYSECPFATPIMCATGACVSSRENCPVLKVCETNKVLCPDLSCADSVDSCGTQIGCPSGTVLCADRTCLPSGNLCRPVECPANTPFTCQDGFCVSNLNLCDLSNGCPYSLPNKCANGQCVANLTFCPSNNTISCPIKGDILCPDGSCASHIKKCPLSNGCSEQSPLKCSNGKCINPLKVSCPKSRCPEENPIKCTNGICMKSKQACSAIYDPEIDSHCQNGTFYCADGRCVSSLDQCRPVHSCGKLSRCGDGSCKKDKNRCPLVNNTCPSPNSIRCDNGACVSDEDDCLNRNGCPAKFSYKCIDTGLCARNLTDCIVQAKKVYLSNGCTLDKPYIENNTCVAEFNKTITNAVSNCSNDTFTCPDGSCAVNISTCSKCALGEKRCFDQKTCVKSNETSKCPNKNGCPKKSPFKCADGTCVSSFKDLANKCKPHLPCLDDPEKYLCADGNCEASSQNCRVLLPCDNDEFRCPDLSCASNSTDCNLQAFCPPTSAIRCPSGKCVDSLEECNENTCANILCYDGECANSSAYCVSTSQRRGATSRILVGTNVTIDGECTSEVPIRCGDGSCQDSKSQCSIVPGCNSLLKPLRCWDGTCVDNSASCPNDEFCFSGTRCEDGICRSECLDYDGCPLSAPYQCPNGVCSQNISGCYRNGLIECADKSLVSAIDLCDRPFRTLRTQALDVTVSSNIAMTSYFITDDATTTKYATLVIPEAALKNGTNSYSILSIKPVAQSTINETDTFQTHTEKIIAIFNKNTLIPNQFIRSAIFNLSNSLNNFNQPLNLSITIDFLIGSSGFDYCLAILSKRRWECVSRPNLQPENANYSILNFEINSVGIYTVIYNPDNIQLSQRASVTPLSSCDWWCDNKGTVLGIIVGFTVSVMVLALAVYGYLKYSKKGSNGGERLLSEQDERKLEDLNKQLGQKDKIIHETTQECNNSKEQNIKLTHEIENLQAEIDRIRSEVGNQAINE